MQESSQRAPLPEHDTPLAPSTPPHASTRRRTIVLVVLVVLLVLGGLGYLRYNGPVDTVKGFFTALLIDANASAVIDRTCPANSLQLGTVDNLQKSMDAEKSQITYDLSGVTYSILSENFFSEAVVRVGGTSRTTSTFNGQTQSTSTTGKGVVHLKSLGFGWCVYSLSNG